jgi:hypothetical protein
MTSVVDTEFVQIVGITLNVSGLPGALGIAAAYFSRGSLFILYIQGYGFGRVMDSNDFRTVE